EKTPSFSVNPSLGIYKCFGCGVAGDPFQFVMAIENATFVEAVRILAEKAGIAIPEEEEGEDLASELDAVYHALRYAARFYYKTLTADARGAAGLTYLRERGFTAETIKRFGLGFAPDAWSALHDVATRDHVSEEVLEKAGLILPRKDGSGFYDRFRNRVIFPIISHMGKVLGFGARILVSEPSQPKYINSPETAVYHKGRVLYGLFQARRAIREQGEVILVEGYTDVMSLHQAGVEHVVASSGTALTQDQVKLLGRYAQRVVLLYDADAAGESASVRGLERVLEAGMAAYAVALPAGQDPDSYVREFGGEAFVEYVKAQRQDFLAFRYALAEREGMLSTPDGQAEAVGQLLELITAVEDPLAQETYLHRASEVTGMPQTTLWRAFEQRRRSREGIRARAPERAPRPAPVPPREVATPRPGSPLDRAVASLPAEEALLRLMIEHGGSMIEFVLSHMNLLEFSEGAPRRAAEALLQQFESDSVDPRALLEAPDDPELRAFLAGVMTDREVPSENWARKLNIPVPRLNERERVAAAGAMTQLKLYRVQQEIASIRDELQAAREQGSDVTELARRSETLHELRKQIERQEFIQWPEAVARRPQG
ncbi:MAG TPA: DNA primase, partial [Rhodothermales bacterium]